MRCLFIVLTVGILINSNAQNKSIAKNPELAKQLGADEYGMKQYVFAFLKRGSNKIADSTERKRLLAAHLSNIGKLADEGKLVLAGPFMDNSDFRGIYIFNTPSIDEAKQWTMTDPAVAAGMFDIELKPWYGSAALMKVIEIHKTLEKVDVTKQK